MTDPHALALRNATMSVPHTALGMFSPRNVSMGVWGDVYGGLTWPVIGRAEDFGQVVDDIANESWHYGRHEP